MNTYQLITSMKSQFTASIEEYINRAIDRYIYEMFEDEEFQKKISEYFNKLKSKNVEVNIEELLLDALIYPADIFKSGWLNLDEFFSPYEYIYKGKDEYKLALKLWDLFENKNEEEVSTLLLNKFTDSLGVYISEDYMDILKKYENIEFCQEFLKYINDKEWRDAGTKTPDEEFGEQDWGF